MFALNVSVPPLNWLVPAPPNVPPASLKFPPLKSSTAPLATVVVAPSARLPVPLIRSVPLWTSMIPRRSMVIVLIVAAPAPALLRSVPVFTHCEAGPPLPWLNPQSPWMSHSPALVMIVVGVEP